ncbi:hypothetical protein DIZ27_36485 [Streptomyces sp. NWU339]|nr:hypothetical protein DIZ27_36485 [Streptomyces sp. NWU339]
MPSTWTVAVSTAFTFPPVTFVSEEPEAELVTWATTLQPAALQLRSALLLSRNWMSLSTALSNCLVLRTRSSNNLSTFCWDSELTSTVPSDGAAAKAARHRCTAPAARERTKDTGCTVCLPVPSPKAEGSDGIDGIDGKEGSDGTGGSEGALASIHRRALKVIS